MNTTRFTHKWLLCFALTYVLVHNIAYMAILLLSPSIYNILNSWVFILYAVSLPLMFAIVRILGLDWLYHIGVLNPLVAPILMHLTPDSWNIYIGYAAVCCTAIMLAMYAYRFTIGLYRISHDPNGGGVTDFQQVMNIDINKHFQICLF